MAKEVITRFKLETTQYDSKIKNAAKELSDFTKTAKSAGRDFDAFTKSQVNAARALGTITTSSTNAKDKAKELVGAFNDVARSYNQLTDAQKKSDFGKAVSDSLTQLQDRIRKTKQEMQGLGQGGFLSGIGDKMGGALQVLGGNLMTKGVMMAAGTVTSLVGEIQDAVKQGIELAKQGEGIRVAFERLGRGDILDGLREATHGTVTDLELMKAAVKFNDFKLPVEELGTMLAFAQQKAKDTGQSVDYMVDSIVTGLGRKSLMILDNLGLSANEIKEKMKETGDMTKAVGQIIREQMAKAGDYVETAADRAAQANVSLQNKMEELGRKFAPVEEASSQLWTSMKIGILDIIGGPLATLLNQLTEAGRLKNQLNAMNSTGSDGQTHTQRVLGALRNYSGNKQDLYNRQMSRYSQLETQAWQEANSAQRRYTSLTQKGGNAQVQRQLYDQWKDAERRAKAWQQMAAQYQAGAKSILNPSANTLPVGDVTTPKGGKTTKAEVEAVTGSIDEQAKKVADLQKAWRAAADDDSRAKIKKQIEEAQFVLDKMNGKTSGIPAMNYGLGNLAGKYGSGLFQEPLFKMAFDPNFLFNGKPYDPNDEGMKAYAEAKYNETKKDWKLDDKTIKAVAEYYDRKTTKTEANLTKEVGNIASGIGGIFNGIESLGVELPQGMKDVLNGIQGVVSILTSISTIVTAIQALTAADTIIPFARGGVVRAASGYMVPGNYGYDAVPALLSSGEVVLNRAQASNLASQLSDNNGGGRGYTPSHVSGEQIWIALNAFTRRTGKGELVTWR